MTHPLRPDRLAVALCLSLAVAASAGEVPVGSKPASRPAVAGGSPASRPAPLAPGDTVVTVDVDGRPRTALVHVPPNYDPAKPTPLVLAFHGLGMTGHMMVPFSGLSDKADQAGFVVAYPDGVFLSFNAWAKPGANGRGPVDDVAFTARLIDDLSARLAVDPRRVFATGMSNGGMMCHRLAAELSDRIAAVAPVAGTLAMPGEPKPARPVPVIHFHGTADTIVPFAGPRARGRGPIAFKSVEQTIAGWVTIDACPDKPAVTRLPDTADDGTTVTVKAWGPGRDGAEVVLVEIEGGGHTWPGRAPPVRFIGKSTRDVSANDLIWDFFRKHPKP